MAGGSFGGGDGSSELTPYLVEDALDLDAVRNDLTAYYKQTQNIDLNISPFNEGEGWLPIGDSSNNFTGSYDGDNNTITNLYINRTSEHTGLFGFCVNNELKNIKLINVLITNSGDYCGGLAGGTDGNSFIADNCSVAGSISLSSSADNVGGLIGRASGVTDYMRISNCSTNVTISSEVDASRRIGGLIGYGGSINLYNSYSTGIVRGVNDVGGLIGETGSRYTISHVSFCYSTCDVYSFSTATGTGGLIGASMKTHLSKSFARGNITSINTGTGVLNGTGGLVGGASSTSGRFLNIAQCYSTGAVNGVIGTNMGGLVGTTSSRTTITNSVYDSETSGQSDTNRGSIPKTTAEMKTKSTYTDLGWSF